MTQRFAHMACIARITGHFGDSAVSRNPTNRNLVNHDKDLL
ncbi:Uncharacterised protein [Vibrio cholerae]|nr:Uncharacterised protein [Vibrio cholerae]